MPRVKGESDDQEDTPRPVRRVATSQKKMVAIFVPKEGSQPKNSWRMKQVPSNDDGEFEDGELFATDIYVSKVNCPALPSEIKLDITITP